MSAAPVFTSTGATRARLAELAARPSTPLPVPDAFRRAAVLLLVAEHAGGPVLVLTERSARMRSHSGEIALPGGRIDPGESPEQAAVREAVEEVAADPAAIELLGRLDEGWSKAGNHVVPVVAWYAADPGALRPATVAATRVFLTPLAAIADPAAHHLDRIEVDGHVFENDVVSVPDAEIYGLTADLVLDLVAWLDGRERDRVPVRAADLERVRDRFV